MLLGTILNRVKRYKGFVYDEVTMVSNRATPERLEVRLGPRRGSRGTCSDFGRCCPGHDQLGDRHFDYIPLQGIPVVSLYCMRRVQCPECCVGAWHW